MPQSSCGEFSVPSSPHAVPCGANAQRGSRVKAHMMFAALLATAIPAAQASPQRLQAAASAITVDYPAAGSVFPPDLVPPTLEWRDAEPRAKLWEIEFAFGDGAAGVLGGAYGMNG